MSSYRHSERVFFLRSIVAIKGKVMNECKISRIGNSGTVGEGGVTISGMVIVYVLPQTVVP